MYSTGVLQICFASGTLPLRKLCLPFLFLSSSSALCHWLVLYSDEDAKLMGHSFMKQQCITVMTVCRSVLIVYSIPACAVRPSTNKSPYFTRWLCLRVLPSLFSPSSSCLLCTKLSISCSPHSLLLAACPVHRTVDSGQL